MKGEFQGVGLAQGPERVPEAQDNALAEQRDRERLAFAYLTLEAIVAHLGPGRASDTSNAAPRAPRVSPTIEQSLAQATASEQAVAEGTAPSAPRRISVEMQAGELGRVAIAVDRGPGGIAVELMIENTHAAQLAQMQREGLLAALESHGMPVTSVNVSQGIKSGIALARSLASGPAPKSRPASESKGSEGGSESKAVIGSRKRLKLMG